MAASNHWKIFFGGRVNLLEGARRWYSGAMPRGPNLLFQTDPALGLPPWLRFTQPTQILCARRLDEVARVLDEVEAARGRGQWAAGFVCYEAAPAFDAALAAHPTGPLPLAWFGIFNAPQPADPPAWPEPGPALALSPGVDAATYRDHIATIKGAIARGETYQVNYTLRLRGAAPDDAADWFARLHQAQRGGYSALLELPDFTICSASPELFFLQHGGQLTCQPMKGTAARGAGWADDEARGAALQQSAKDRAENVMIVDMVRNDLGRLAAAGAVHTPRLFEVQRLPTLWQMTSTVTAESEAGLGAVFSALFPCASITGAPKVRTTHLIRDLEPEPRGVYTGAIGLAGPGGLAQFSVAIRTLVHEHRSGTLEYGVGSGVVWDSEGDREYAECLSKALILGATPGPFHLLATLAWRKTDGYRLLERHLRRLRRAATYFGFAFDGARIQTALQQAAAGFTADGQRVRLLVSADGAPTLEAGPLPAAPDKPWRLALARAPVDPDNPFLYFKTTQRAAYTQARQAGQHADDVVLWNTRGEVTESTIANLAVRRDDRWVTPPLRCGLLDGVLREELLESGQLTEALVTVEEFRHAPELALLNNVRGWIPAVWDEGCGALP